MQKNKKPLSWTSLLQEKIEQILKNLKQLKKIVKKWHQIQEAGEVIPTQNHTIIIKYLRYLCQTVQIDRFKEFILEKQYDDRNFDQANSEKQIYINYKIFGTNTLWTLLLSKEVIDQFQQLDEDTMISLLARLSLYMQGYIPISEKKQYNTLTQLKKGHFKNRYYKESQGDQNYSLLLSIGVQKVPCYDFNNIHKISQFAYKNYIEIISVLQPQIDKKNIEKLIENCEELQKQNPTKNFENEELVQNKVKMNPKTVYFKYMKKEEINDQIYCMPPILYQSQKLTNEKCQDYFFTLYDYETEKKFIQSKQNQVLTSEQQQFQRERRDQKQYMRRFKIQKPKTLVALVDGFQKYKLTNDQKQIIWAPHNTITLGRSGTGKTVSAIVKLLSIEMYLKKKQHTLMKQLNQTKEKFSAADIAKSIGLRNIFLTASQKLIFEIKNIYDDLIVDIQTEGRLRNNQNEENSNILENQTQSIFQTIQDFNVEDENIDIFEAYNQKQMNKKKIKSFNKLKEKDYPGFFSISQFITLIDGTTSNPFFKVQKQEKTQENQMAKIQQKIGCADLDEEIFQIQEDQYNEKMGKQDKKVNKIRKRTKMTYNMFYSLFWQSLDLSVFKTMKELSPAVVWSEIYSTIKGSVTSHRSHSKYLSKAKYLRQSQDKFYDRQDKKVIYSIFQYYEDWKNETGYFDQMDVVNRILSQIRKQGYRGPLLNFLFIDEVQDLTPATLYLLSKLFQNGLFYFGDTAQSIAKGVSFKFGDIQKMFSKKFEIQYIPHNCPQRIPLTVNFRSHNQILQLANSVISSIEFLFEGSIDVMKKEKSNFHGPRPILINKVNEVMLLELLTDQITDKSKIDADQLKQFTKNVEDQRYFKLSAQQAIIIRSAQEQKKLPYRLQQATILTYQQAKGLQYDDIILYNYFSSSKDKEMWKLLSYLDVIIVPKQKSEYQKQIQLRQNQIYQNQKKLQIDLQEEQDQNKEISTPQLQNGFYKVKTIVVNEKKIIKDQDRNKYYDLLSELKILYTIITRAKKTFVIYDTKLPPQLENLWMKMGLIKCIKNQQQLLQEKGRISRYKAKYKSKNYLQEQKSYKKQGIKWFFNKNYDKAIKAFKNINQTKAIQRVLAQKLKYECQMQMKKIQNEMKNPKKLQKELFKIKKKSLQNRRQILAQNFIQAGKMFENINCLKSAGNCYYEGQNYKMSLFCFQKCKFTLGCAEACKKLGKFEQAAKYFEELKMIQKMFQCYEKTQNWKKTFDKLNQYKQNEQVKKKAQKFYKNYGNQYLCEIVSQFKQSVNGFNNVWKTNHQFEYISPLQKSQSNDYFKRKISEECKIYTDKLRNAYSMLKIYENKDQSLKKEILNTKQQLARIYLTVQTIQPFQKMQKVKLYDIVWSQYERTGKGKQLEQFIKRENAQNHRPIIINERYVQKVKNQLKKHKNELMQKQKQLQILKDKMNQNAQQINNIQIRYGPLKKIIQKFEHFYLLWKKFYFTNAKNNNIMKEINALENQKIQQQNQYVHLQEFKRLNPQQKQHYEQFQIEQFSQILDDSFDTFSNYSQQEMQQNKASVVFNFSIQKSLLKFIVAEAKQVISKSSSFIHNNIKGPFSKAHHLSLNSKIQSYITIQLKRLDLQEAFSLCKKIQFIGEYELCLLVSSYYQCYQNCKKYIISHCTNYSQTFKKSTQVLEVRNKMYQQKQKSKHSQIYLFLNRINPQFLQKQTFRTLYSKQKIINAVVQSLILLGNHHQVFKYLSKNQKVQLSCYFMNYQKMIESLRNQSNMQRRTQNRQIQQPYYYFVNEKVQFADMINFSTFQEIFWYYDSYQDNSFLSQNDWIQSVVLDDRQCDTLSRKVQNFMKKKEMQIKNLKKKIEQLQQQYYINIPTRHTQQKSNTVETLKKIKKQLQNLKIDQKELRDLVNQLYHQRGNLISNIEANRKKIKQNLAKVDQKIRNIRKTAKVFKELNKFCQIHVLQSQILFEKQNALRNYLKQKPLKKQIKKEKKIQQNYLNLVEQFKYNIQQLQELQNQKRNKVNIKLIQFYKQCLKAIELIDTSQLKSSFRADYIQKVKAQFRFVEQNEKMEHKNYKYDQQIREKQNSIQSYKIDIEQTQKQINEEKQNLKREENLWKYHEDELKQIQLQIRFLQKAKKENQKNLQKQESQFRLQIFNQRRIQLACQNKQRYKEKTVQKIRNFSDDSSKRNEMAFLKQMINGFQQKFQQANTYHYKMMLFRIIQNGKKSIKKLDVFQISQIIMLYLSCINYFDFAKKIGEFLLIQEEIAISKAFEDNLDSLDKKIRLKKQQILKLKTKSQEIGYMNAVLKSQLNTLQNQLYELQQNRKYTPRQKVKIDQQKRCHRQFIKTMNCIYERISIPDCQEDIRFIFHLLGFFQCKVIQNSKLLWFLDCQYVLVKSTSIIVKQAVKYQNIFCYYMDDNKQIILMKLHEVYKILKAFIRNKQKSFIEFAGYKFKDTKQKFLGKQLFMKIKETNLDTKQNKLAMESQLFCNRQKKSQIQELYKYYTQQSITKNIQNYKLSLFEFYFKNEFKSHQNFHFFLHQLKSICQIQDILLKTPMFCYSVMNQIKNLYDNLQNEFIQWTKYYQHYQKEGDIKKEKPQKN